MRTPPRADDDTLARIFPGDSEMSRRMRAFDWSTTPLGPAEGWPQSLRTAVSFLLASKAQIVLFWGPELTTLYNDAYAPVFGGKHPAVLGRPVADAWSEIWLTTLKDLFDGVLATGEAYWANDRPFFVERFGYREETFFDVSYDPVRDESGAVAGLFCIVTETTRRVISERRLKTLRAVAAETAEPKSVEEACEIAARLLRESAHDVPFAAIYLVDDAATQARLTACAGLRPNSSPAPETVELIRASEAGDVWSFREVLERGQPVAVKDVRRRFGALSGGAWPEPVTTAVVLPVKKSGQDRIAGFLIAGVSPRLVLDEQYAGFFDLLANQLATAISSARAYEEERRRGAALAELDRAKTAFFSNVSHEFRTPLTLMLGPLADALEASWLPQAGRESLDLAHRNGLRLLRLVNTLLDFSRIEAGRAGALFEDVDAAQLTTDLASVFRSAIERAGLSLDVRCARPTAPVFLDRDMWEKVVLNLLSNAFKFTLHGSIVVSLTPRDTFVDLVVQDTGVGIPAQELPHVFERFHRVRGSEGRTHEGTGIGLALVSELVKLHGGRVGVTSELGRGSTFTVSIPTGSAHLPQDRIGASRTLTSTALGAGPFLAEALRWLPQSPLDIEPVPDGGRVGAITTTGATVLVVDDNADMRAYLVKLLGPHWQVETAADGEEALRQIQRRRPDLVLSDVMMPHVDGIELIRRLRNDTELRTIPVVLLSARAGEESRVEGVESGADDYLTKPFSARELLARINANLEMARVRAEVVAERERTQRLLLEQKQLLELIATGRPLDECLTALADAVSRLEPELRSGVLMTNAGRTHVGEVPPEDMPERAHHSTPILGPDGKVVASFALVLGTVRPPTAWELQIAEFGAHVASIAIERDRAAAKLQSEEARYRGLVEATASIVWRADSAGLVTDASQWTDFTGQEREHYVGHGWRAMLHPEDAERTLELWARGMREKVPVSGEHRLKRPDGTYRWMSVTAVPILGATGDVEEWVGIVVDIDARKRTEQEREEFLAIAERARTEAEAANQAKDAFLAVLSHELRSPMNAMLGWLRILKTAGTRDLDLVGRAVETLERNIWIQAQVINDLLDVSRIMSGKLELERTRVDLASVVTGCVESLRPSAEGKQVALRLRLEASHVEVVGDSGRLQQVVANLLGNAVKFTDTGGFITVTLEQRDGAASIVVEDTGQGIAPEFLPHLFERFRQGDSSSVRKHGGLGLGLAIVKNVVALHGGEVRAESDGVGRGARFAVILPQAEGRQRLSFLGAAVTIPKKSGPLPALDVLVVEDDADSRQALGLALEESGARVRTADSVRRALDAYNARPPDIVISDIGMPGQDGYVLIRAIREREEGRSHQTLAIAMTGFAGIQDREMALRAGFDEHVAKPVELDVLLERVRILGATRAAGRP